jgi:hypothetical protein
MPSSKLTKVAFNIADIACWLMVVLSIGTLVVVFFPPYISTWSVMGLPTNMEITLEVINTLINGFGFYLLIKRKPIGFVFIAVTSVFELIATMYFHVYTVYYLLVLVVIVSAPWVLVSREIANASANET